MLFNNSSNDIIENKNDKDNVILDDINRIQSHKNVVVNEISNIESINTRNSIHTTTSNDRIDLSKLNSNEIAILQYDSRPLSDYWYYILLLLTTINIILKLNKGYQQHYGMIIIVRNMDIFLYIILYLLVITVYQMHADIIVNH